MTERERLQRAAEALIQDTEELRAQGETVGVCLAWYSQDAWAQLRAIPEARVCMSYREFEANWQILAAAFAAEGLMVAKAPVSVDQMLSWCRRYGCAPDAEGRDAYGAALLAAHDTGLNVMDVPALTHAELTLWRPRMPPERIPIATGVATPSQADRPTLRSAVTNGSRALHDCDLRSKRARRYRDLVAAYTRDLGGSLSTAEVAQVKLAAGLTMRAEDMQSALVRGEAVSDEEHVRICNALARVLAELGISRRRDEAEQAERLRQYQEMRRRSHER
jgi:hypothetical protein